MAWFDQHNKAVSLSASSAPLSWTQYKAILDKQREAEAATTPAPKKGNFLTSLIPTAGGTAGALGGAALGASVGSVVPGLGTAIGGLAGALIGGAAGGGLGKVGENAIEGQSDLGQGVAQEALIGGATSLPLGAGLKLAGAGVKLGTGLGSKTAGQLITEAGAKTVPKALARTAPGATKTITPTGNAVASTLDQALAQPAAQSTVDTASKFTLPGRLREAGNSALMSQYGTIGKPFARSTNPRQTIATLADAGIVKPVDAERIAGTITGGRGVVTQAVSDAVAKAGGVDATGLDHVLEDAIANHGLVDADAKSVRQVFNAQLGKLSADGASTTAADPKKTIGVIRSLEKRIANLNGKGDNYRLSTPERADQANVLQTVRDELENRLYQGAGANANVKSVLTPELRDKLVALMPENPKWTSYIDKQVMGAKTVGDLRGSMAPFVRIGKIIDEGDRNSMTFGGRVGNAFAGGGGGVFSAIGEGITSLAKGPAARVAGTTLRATADALPENANSKTLLGALRRVGANTATAAPSAVGTKAVGQGIVPLGLRQYVGHEIAPSVLAPAHMAADQPVTSPLGSDQPAPLAPTEPAPQAPGPSQNPFGASSSDFAAAYTRAIAAGDTKAATQLKSLYDLSNQWEQDQAKAASDAAKVSSGSTPGYSKPSASQYSQAVTALQSVDQLEKLATDNMVNTAATPGQDLPIIGSIESNALGTGQYRAVSKNILNSIARINTGANMPASEQRFYEQTYLPQPGDSPQTKATKIANLRGFFAPIVSYQGGSSATDLLSALGQ